MMIMMEVEVLVVPDCPNEVAARELVRDALAELRLVIPVTTTVVADDDDARARAFTGSPTFLIDGRDPFLRGGATAGMACRLYRTPSGLAGLPPREELRDALRLAAAR